MRKLNFVFGVLLILMLSISCSSDDDDTSSNVIVGEWKMINNWIPFFGNATNILDCASLHRYQFSLPDGFTKTEYEQNENGECEKQNTYSGTWKITDNKLTIKAMSISFLGGEGEEERVFEIHESSESVLTLKVKLDPTITNPSQEEYFFYYFEK